MSRPKDELNERIFAAAEAYGLPRVDDINASDGERVGYIPNTVRNGFRLTAARAFLTPALKRKNLSLELNTHVSRILFDGTRATGVRARSGGVTRDFAATTEVIVCAGALDTPLLLERSGVGDPRILHGIGVRFANRAIEPVWSAEHVASVLVRFDETLGLENRARYYDHAGAMDDMLQSHLLQVLAVLAMEPPATLDERDLRDAKAQALRATRLWRDDPATSSRRARYTAGRIDGRELPAYVDEPGVDAGRETETLAEIVCEVRTARWAGVPFTLRSGKALGENRAEVVVTFAPVRHLPPGLSGTPRDGGTLRFGLGPETMSLELNVNGGEDGLFALERETLRIEPGDEELYAYTEVLGEILERDVTLSVRADSAERCWRIVEPVRRAWDRDEVPLEEYRAGSAGPEGWASSQV